MDNEKWTKYCEDRIDRHSDLIPNHMVDGLKNYVLRGIRPGSFLTAVMANYFKEACGRADMINSNNLSNWACIVVNAVPSEAQGSYEKVEKWIEYRGQIALEDK